MLIVPYRLRINVSATYIATENDLLVTEYFYFGYLNNYNSHEYIVNSQDF